MSSLFFFFFQHRLHAKNIAYVNACNKIIGHTHNMHIHSAWFFFSYFITFIMYRDKFDNFICYLTNGFSIQYFLPPAMECTECWHNHAEKYKKTQAQAHTWDKKEKEMNPNDVLFLYIILLNVRQVRNSLSRNWFVPLFGMCIFVFFLLFIFHSDQSFLGSFLFHCICMCDIGVSFHFGDIIVCKFITKFHKIYLLKWDLSMFG